MTSGLPDLPVTGPEWVFLVLMASVLVAPVAARRLRLPGLLGLILVGTLIGPNVLGLVERDGFVETMGGAGLLFLMFMAGLELDLGSALQRFRSDTIVFGVATFLVPLTIGVAVLSWWGFAPLAAVLLASTWSSHTVVSYPIFQRYGVVNNRGVAVAIGATLITNVSALLVLAVVIALHVGGTGPGTWVVLVGGLGLLAAGTLLGLPRLTRWFFAGLGGDRLVQVLYVLAVMFAAASFAGAVGIEPIVGAFFAGLGLNQHVPKRGVLGDRLVFLGDTLLIPLFLVSVGMLIDPVSLVSGWSLVIMGTAFAAQSMGGKLVAALAVGRWRNFSRDETGAMFSLTSADAAATLAAVLVGLQVGLFEQQVIEAIVLVILGSCTVSTFVAERFAPRIAAPPPDDGAMGRNVIVPVANPATAGRLTEFAARLASEDGGTVYPVNVLGPHSERAQVIENDGLLVDAEASALRVGVEAHGSVRIADSLATGVLNQVVERDATAVVMGWKGYASAREHLFGGVLDTLIGQLRVPTLLCRLEEESKVARIVVHAGRLGQGPGHDRRLAVAVAERLASSYQVPLVLIGTERSLEKARRSDSTAKRAELVTDDRPVAEAVAEHTDPSDLVVVGAGLRDHVRLPESIAARLPGRDLVIAIGLWHGNGPKP